MSLPTSYTYQWYSNGMLIPGATTANYVIQTSDIGNQLTCTVTAINSCTSITVTTPLSSVVTS